jgi:catechol-2,3-dioxygenase
MAVRRLNHAVLYVSDVPHSVAFYQAALGLEIAHEYGDKAAFLRAPESFNDHDLGLFATGPANRLSDAPKPGLYHLAWEVGTLPELVDIARRLRERGALVGASDHRVSKSLYAKDPDGIEFEVMWRVPAADWEAEMATGEPVGPLDLDAALARWGDLPTGAAAGSAT